METKNPDDKKNAKQNTSKKKMLRVTFGRQTRGVDMRLIMKSYLCLWSNIYQTESSMHSFAEPKIFFVADRVNSLGGRDVYIIQYTWIPDVVYVTSWHAISVLLISIKSDSIISNPRRGIRVQEHFRWPRFVFLSLYTTPTTFFQLMQFSVYFFPCI